MKKREKNERYKERKKEKKQRENEQNKNWNSNKQIKSLIFERCDLRSQSFRTLNIDKVTRAKLNVSLLFDTG